MLSELVHLRQQEGDRDKTEEQTLSHTHTRDAAAATHEHALNLRSKHTCKYTAPAVHTWNHMCAASEFRSDTFPIAMIREIELV